MLDERSTPASSMFSNYEKKGSSPRLNLHHDDDISESVNGPAALLYDNHQIEMNNLMTEFSLVNVCK
jgi:hypothetical protein